MYFFFFQAEDGIRDVAVTGVQTCALPISPGSVGFRHSFARFRRILCAVGPQWLDTIRNAGNTFGRNAIPNIFGLHVLRMCDQGPVSLEQLEATCLGPVEFEHRDRIQPTAAPRIEMKQTLPPKPAIARPGNGLLESLVPADAGTVISMSKENGRCDLQKLPLEFDARYVVTIDHVRPPLTDSCQCAVQT